MCKSFVLFGVLVALGLAWAGGAKAASGNTPPAVCKTQFQNCQASCFASRNRGSCQAACVARYNQCLRKQKSN